MAKDLMKRILVAGDARTEYGRGLLAGIGRYAQAIDRWRVVVREARTITLDQLAGEVDGIIGQLVHFRQVERFPLPTVNLSSSEVAAADAWVCLDSRLMAELAIDHFRSKGLRHIAFVTHVTGLGSSRSREQAVLACAEAAGLPASSFLSAVGDIHKPDRKLGQWLKDQPQPLGVIAFNDETAIRVLVTCRDVGLTVPDEVAILGVDDDPLRCLFTNPPLSSIPQPAERIGYEGALRLDQLIEGRPLESVRLTLSPMGVTQRQSSDVLAIADVEVATAVRYIRAHLRDPIGVDHVVAQVPLTRRALELRFRKALGRTPADEIRRARIEAARRLLTHTNFSMEQVADMSGLVSASRMAQLFKKVTGESPSACRARFATPVSGGRQSSA